VFGKKKAIPKDDRILFATDLHGSEQVFRKFLAAAGSLDAGVCVLGGDISGKIVVPLVRQGDSDVYASEFMGTQQTVPESELEEFMKRIRFNGQYPFVTSGVEYEAVSSDTAKQHELFIRLMCQEMERWLALANERLTPVGATCYVTGGNDDPFELEEALMRAESERVVAAEDRTVTVTAGHEMVSCGYGNPTPWDCPRDIDEDELLERLEAKMQTLKDPTTAICNFHIPPYDSTLDMCAKLDTSVYPPQPKMGEVISAGSTAVRQIVEKYQPLLVLCGHIHESRGAIKLGRTLCVNPGSEYSEGVLRAVVVELQDGGVKSHRFICG